MSEGDPLAAMVAFLFQRSGRQGMSENELANAVSLDLKWYAPKAARELIAGLVRAGWLQRDDDGDLEPTFDVKAVKVPIGFRPPREVPDVPPPGTYTQPPAGAPSGPAARPSSPSSSGPDAAARRDDPRGGDGAPDASGRDPTGNTQARGVHGASGPDDPRDHADRDHSDHSDHNDHDDGDEAPDVADTLLGRLLERLADETGEDRGAWVARMDDVVQRTRDAVAPEVALLIAAAKKGVRVDEWLDEARALPSS